ncbi:hypothetical protein [Mycobacteroides saopaulense]|nr:hypothetical protein [Mycobacteroides saopaulense]
MAAPGVHGSALDAPITIEPPITRLVTATDTAARISDNGMTPP